MQHKPILAQGSNYGTPINCKGLTGADCTFNVNALVGKTSSSNSGSDFLGDIVSGALFFIGIFVSITLVISGLLYIFAGADEKQAEKGKTGVKYALIGLFLVVASYAIIKLAQTIAKG